jgi:hypothetical protein
VTLIGKNEATRIAMGLPPAYYFVDVFVLNQAISIETRSHNLLQVMVGQRIRELRDTLLKSQSCLLCCSPGPTGDPGWVKAAPLSRIW